jgi:hypothetical protein
LPRVCRFEQINGRSRRRDRAQQAPEELVSLYRPHLHRVVTQSALATLGGLQKNLPPDWRQRPTTLLAQTHGSIVHETGFSQTPAKRGA